MKDKTTIKRRVVLEYVLTEEDKKMVLRFLNGEMTCRELGKQFGISHQQAINLTCSVCRQWYQKGKLALK